MPLTATFVPALALLLLGLWWTGAGLVLRPTRPWLARLTLLLAGLTLLDAFDKAVLMIPWTPLSPAWVRSLVAVVWILWAVVASARPAAAPDPGDTREGGDRPGAAGPAPAPNEPRAAEAAQEPQTPKATGGQT